MVGARIAQDVAHAPARPGPRLPRRQHHPRQTRQLDRPGAHGAGLEGDHQRAAVQVRVAQRRPGGPQREDLRVRRRIALRLSGVGSLRDHPAVGPQDDGAHRHLAALGGPARQLQGAPHRRPVAILDHAHGHSLARRPEPFRKYAPPHTDRGEDR